MADVSSTRDSSSHCVIMCLGDTYWFYPHFTNELDKAPKEMKITHLGSDGAGIGSSSITLKSQCHSHEVLPYTNFKRFPLCFRIRTPIEIQSV